MIDPIALTAERTSQGTRRGRQRDRTLAAGFGPPSPASSERLRRLWWLIAVPLVSILLALVVGAVIILVSELLVGGAPSTWRCRSRPMRPCSRARSGRLQRHRSTRSCVATPLILARPVRGLGFKAGLFNIGAQGQFLIGGLGCGLGGRRARATPRRSSPSRWPCWRGIAAGACLGLHPGRAQGRTPAPTRWSPRSCSTTSPSSSCRVGRQRTASRSRVRLRPITRRRQRRPARSSLGRQWPHRASSSPSLAVPIVWLAAVPDARSASRSGPSAPTRTPPGTPACGRGSIIMLTMSSGGLLAGPGRRHRDPGRRAT